MMYSLPYSDTVLNYVGMHIVHGRPRNPQTQGLIERATAILTDALGKYYQNKLLDRLYSNLSLRIYNSLSCRL